MNNSMSHPTSIRIARTKEHFPSVRSFVEKATANCGFADRDTLSMTLAAEEIFVYLCQGTQNSQTIDISYNPKTYYLRLEFQFTEGDFDYRAFNLTHKTNIDAEEDILSIGLLLVARMVDQLCIIREKQNLFRLVLVKEKTYTFPEP